MSFWPDVVPGLGPKRTGQPFARCADCPADEHPSYSGTYVAYGDRALCQRHARARVAAAERKAQEAAVVAKQEVQRVG